MGRPDAEQRSRQPFRGLDQQAEDGQPAFPGQGGEAVKGILDCTSRSPFALRTDATIDRRLGS
jgi:hypothetical protein